MLTGVCDTKFCRNKAQTAVIQTMIITLAIGKKFINIWFGSRIEISSQYDWQIGFPRITSPAKFIKL